MLHFVTPYVTDGGACVTNKNISVFLMECMAKSLIELLKEKPLSAISVSEITQKAGVSRMTFYRNYSSKEDIFEKYMDYLIECYHREVMEKSRHASYIRYENILLGFEHFRQNSEFVLCLLNSRLGSNLRAKIIQNELDLSLSSQGDEKSRYITIAYANALFGVMTEWVQDGMKDSPEELAQLICDLFQQKIRRY